MPRQAYDDVVTSGEAARQVLAARPGARVLHVGPERDLNLYDGLPVTLGGEDDCDLIACTGLVDDERETPDDYRARLARWHRRALPMLCVNPDVVVERGGRLVWCAGAIAERYRELGAETIVVGKPYAEIYRAALDRIAEIAGGVVAPSSLLAVGDGIDTDVRGAVAQGIDVAFVTDGIHAAVFGSRHAPDLAAVHAFLATAGLGARCLLKRLVW
ncbi:MAG: HAD hydrolase-like protein [Bauldia sp.]